MFSIGISNQVTWAPADVASQVVLAKSSVVTRMLLAFIDIDTVQPAVVFIAKFAFTKRLAVLHSACAMGSALYPVARTFTHKIDTLLVKGAVGVVQAVHLNASPVLVIWVTGVKGILRTSTLPLVVDNSTGSIGATRFFAWIDALGDSVLVAGCVQGTVNVPPGALSGVGAPREAVPNESLRAAAQEATHGVLADARRVARVVHALVDIFAAVVNVVEARLAGAVVERADLVHLAVAV